MASTATATRRLLHEYRQLVNDGPEGIAAGPISEDDFFEWECFIQGPEGTPFDGGIFSATLSFPKVRTYSSVDAACVLSSAIFVITSANLNAKNLV